MKTKNILYASLLGATLGLLPMGAMAESTLTVEHLANQQNIVAVTEAKRYLLLPVQDNAPEAKVGIISGNTQIGVLANIRLARERVDYFVPFSLEGFEGKDVKIDVQGMPTDAVCWKGMKLADTFDTANKEKYRPVYHHTPAYGWMNDPNGMFYKDGTYHLYFQHNPYGSVWGNMTPRDGRCLGRDIQRFVGSRQGQYGRIWRRNNRVFLHGVQVYAVGRQPDAVHGIQH